MVGTRDCEFRISNFGLRIRPLRIADCGLRIDRRLPPGKATIRNPQSAIRNRAQASLEMTLALGGMLLLLLGSFKVFLWINERLVRRHQYYNCTRVAAGGNSPGLWNDPAVRIPLKIFESQVVSANPCP